MTHEEAPRRPDRIDEADPDVANYAQGRTVVREEPVQSIHRERHDKRIETPPAFIFFQRVEVADVEAEAGRVENDLAERRRVLEAEIEPLAGDGMNTVRRVAGEREARRNIAARKMKSQRIGPAWSRDFRGAKMVSEAARELGGEAKIGRASCRERGEILEGGE